MRIDRQRPTMAPVNLYPDDRRRIETIRAAHPALDSTAAVIREAVRRMAEASETPPPKPAAPVAPKRGATPAASSHDPRLTAVMGSLSMAAVDRAAGVAGGTTRSVLRGACPLASAGGGKLLAWVEAQESAAKGAGA